MGTKVTVVVSFRGHLYQANGYYFRGVKGTSMVEQEDSEFEVEHISGLDGGDASIFLEDEEVLDEFEYLCKEEYEADMRYAGADEAYQRMKDNELLH